MILGLCLSSANAKELTPKQVIGQYKYAPLIITADVEKTAQFGLTINVKNVLKGDRKYNYKTIHIPQCVKNSQDRFLHFFTRKKTKHSIILFNKDWLNKPCRPIHSVFHKNTSDINKAILTHQSTQNERKKLKQLIRLIPTEEFKVKKFVHDQFQAMTQKRNFYLFNKLIEKSSCKNKRHALDMMVRTYELRSVPYLIDLLSDNHCDINLYAAKALNYEFAGAKGVTAAFSKNLNNPNVSKSARKYLHKRYANSEYQPLPREPNRHYLGQQALKKGDIKTAVSHFLSYIDTPNNAPCSQTYMSEFSGIKSAMPYVSEAQIEKIYRFVHGLDFQDESINFYHKEVSAELFYLHPRAKNLPQLLTLLKASKTFNRTFRLTLLALSQMDTASRTQALTILKGKLNEQNRYSQKRNLVGMIWLGDQTYVKEILNTPSKLRKTKLKDNEAEALKAIISVADHLKDFEYIQQHLTKTSIASDGLISSLLVQNLMEINHPGTPQVLLNLLNTKHRHVYQTVQDAFVQLNSETVNKMAMELMSSEDQKTRAFATKTLYHLQKERALPLLRKAVQNKYFGDLEQASYYLGLVGTMEDIKLLEPLCDFWQQSDQLVERSCRAMVRIRNKYDHDLNGPVIQSEKNNPFDRNLNDIIK